MPRIKRWSPISHDFNRDSQIIAMRKDFGDWTALAWQEILHEADRNEGVVMGSLPEIALRIAPVSLQKYLGRAANGAQMMLERAADNRWILLRRGSDAAQTPEECDRIQIVNHWKYHRSQEPAPAPSEPDLTRPNLIKDTYVDKPVPKPDLSVQDLVDSWNEVFKDKLPSVEWPLSKSRHAKAAQRLKEHRTQEFWQKVFDNIGDSRFLLGTGNGNWKCTFDFITKNDSNSIKIYEGAYNAQAR